MRIDNDPCRWRLEYDDWSAVLLLDQNDLKVIWQSPGDSEETQCSLPYGLSRADVEAAIQAGPSVSKGI
ncbi:hypothetical protein CREGCYN_14540 [Synechococcus sp. M16CYN]